MHGLTMTSEFVTNKDFAVEVTARVFYDSSFCVILHCKQKHLGVSNINVICTVINTRTNYRRVIILFLVDGNKVI